MRSGHRFDRGNPGGASYWPTCKCGVERKPLHTVGERVRWAYRKGGAWTETMPPHVPVAAAREALEEGR